MFCILFFVSVCLWIFSFFFWWISVQRKISWRKKNCHTSAVVFSIIIMCVLYVCGRFGCWPKLANKHTHTHTHVWTGDLDHLNLILLFVFISEMKVHHSKRLMDFSREKNWLTNERKKNDWSIESSLFFDEFFFLFSLEEKWYSNKL